MEQAIHNHPEYLVSSDGYVISRKRAHHRKMIGGATAAGYPQVTLRSNGVQVQRLVHRLVAEAFLANPSKLPAVNHIDGDKTNNAVQNLEWVTASENMKHSVRTGLWTPPTSEQARQNSISAGQAVSIFTPAQFMEVLGSAEKTAVLAARFHCDRSTIKRIRNGTTKVFKKDVV